MMMSDKTVQESELRRLCTYLAKITGTPTTCDDPSGAVDWAIRLISELIATPQPNSTAPERPDPISGDTDWNTIWCSRREWVAYGNALEAQVAQLRAEIALSEGALDAQDERERLAGERIGIENKGCDWPDTVADVVLELRAEIAKLREFSYKTVVELEYVQCVDMTLCASAVGKELVNEGMKLLGVADLAGDSYGCATRLPAPPSERDAQEGR